MKLPAEITIEVVEENVPTGVMDAEQTKAIILSVLQRLIQSEFLAVSSAYVAGQMNPEQTVGEFMQKRYGR